MDRAEAIALYQKLVATHPKAELKGATVPYTSLNGHMFSALHKDGTVALRLPSPQRESFLKKYKTTLAAHYGVVQPEYVVVPDQLLAEHGIAEALLCSEYRLRQFAKAEGDCETKSASHETDALKTAG